MGTLYYHSYHAVEVPDSAGEGNMEISITGNGRNIKNHVKQAGKGQFEVSYTPMESVPHTVKITFNGVNVEGECIVKVSVHDWRYSSHPVDRGPS